MLDINAFLVEKGGDPEKIKASQKKRGASVELVDEIVADYKNWTRIRFDLDALNKKTNALQKQIGQKFKAKEDASELLEEKKNLAKQKEELTETEQKADADLRFKVNQVGNKHSFLSRSLDLLWVASLFHQKCVNVQHG
ncbi:Cytosolic seryl-tRNA synthetase [Candidozyma auris]